MSRAANIVCGMEVAAFLNEHHLSASESWEYIQELAIERGCNPREVQAFVVEHLYDEKAARALEAQNNQRGTGNMFGLFNRRGRRDVTRFVGRGKGRHVLVAPPTTKERRSLAQAGWDAAFGLPVSEQSDSWISRHPPVDRPTPAFPLTKMQWARAARARAVQGLNGGTLTKREAQSVVDRATRFVRMMVHGSIPPGASRSKIGTGRGKISPPGRTYWNELYDAKIVGSRGSYHLEPTDRREERRAAANRRRTRVPGRSSSSGLYDLELVSRNPLEYYLYYNAGSGARAQEMRVVEGREAQVLQERVELLEDKSDQLRRALREAWGEHHPPEVGNPNRRRGRRNASGHHMRMDGRDYVDTAFMNAMRQVNPQWDLTHMGFGEFYVSDYGEGRADFARMGGSVEIPGASGRTHHFYDNVGGKLTAKIIKALEKAEASQRVRSTGQQNGRFRRPKRFLGIAKLGVPKDESGRIRRPPIGLRLKAQEGRASEDEVRWVRSFERQELVARELEQDKWAGMSLGDMVAAQIREGLQGGTVSLTPEQERQIEEALSFSRELTRQDEAEAELAGWAEEHFSVPGEANRRRRRN